jgi:hypothetical protein
VVIEGIGMRAVSKALGAIATASVLAALGPVAVGAATTASAATSASATTSAKAAPSAVDVDSPPGFAYGTDSWPLSVLGSNPYREPVIWGLYGGYMGMAGNWARVEGCRTGNFLAWSSADSTKANVNYTKYHVGVGTGVYWYMGGPGVDPHWNNTTSEASKWGALQAADALAAMKKLAVTYPVVWADIEMPGIEPALDNGWNSVYSSPCSEHVVQRYVPATIDRAEFNGFAGYITTHSKYKVGVYSAASIWTSIFGTPATTGTASQIPNTYEWTYLPETSRLSAAPAGWCLRGSSTCAQFFGGQSASSKYALMWQWSGGGGVTNGYGDFDQIDVARLK